MFILNFGIKNSCNIVVKISTSYINNSCENVCDYVIDFVMCIVWNLHACDNGGTLQRSWMDSSVYYIREILSLVKFIIE